MENRSLIKDIVLNYLTCGLYGYKIRTDIGKELNKETNGALKLQRSFLMLMLLDTITVGLYLVIVDCKILKACNECGSNVSEIFCSKILPIAGYVLKISLYLLVIIIDNPFVRTGAVITAMGWSVVLLVVIVLVYNSIE